MTAFGVRNTLLAAGTFCGCAAVAGFEDLNRGCPPETPDCATSGTGGGAGAGSTSGSGGSAGSTPDLPGPKMARIDRPDGSYFWIDTTEVTRAQYRAYLDLDLAPSRDSLCTPEGGPNEHAHCAPSTPDGGSDGGLPQTCIDWCEARDYCSWAGKQLCGDHLSKAVDSDYYLACTRPGPDDPAAKPLCGTSYCNVTLNQNDGGATTAGTNESCYVRAADGETRVYDLIGNVAEWTNACEFDQEDSDCTTRGGSYNGLVCCAERVFVHRRLAQPSVGFRCCAYRP